MIKPSLLIDILERDEDILNFKINNNISIWPIVRYDVLISILNNNNNLKTPVSRKRPGLRSLIKTLAIAIYKTPLLIKKNKIIFFNSGVTNVKRDTDGFYINRVTDQFFSLIFKDAVLIEDTAMGELRFPRIHDKVYPHLTLIIFSKLFGVFKKLKNNEVNNTELILKYIFLKLDKEKISYNSAELTNIVQNNLLNFVKRHAFYHVYFKLKKPKLIFLEDASYGNKAFILLTAKALNIPVIELQHGFINEEHIAYNLGPGVIHTHTIKQYYPDKFFVYGDFWKNSIMVPNDIISVGNPYFTSQIEEIKKHKIDNKVNKKILFISSAISIEESIEFLTKLNEIAVIENYEINLRPHPLEVNVVESRYASLISKGIKISQNSSIFNDFLDHEIIIAEASTALFECMIITGRKKFLFMSSYTKSYLNKDIAIPKISLNNISDLFNNDYADSSNESYYWEIDWQKNFIKALQQLT